MHDTPVPKATVHNVLRMRSNRSVAMLTLAILSSTAGLARVSSAQSSQAPGDTSDAAVLEIAYRAVVANIPAGHRVVVVDDPLLHPGVKEIDTGAANRKLASSVGLNPAVLNDVRTCTTPFDCSLTGDIVGSISVKMATRTIDSAVVLVATRYFLPPSKVSDHTRVAWEAIALYEVKLVRRDRRWVVTNVSPRTES